MNPPTDTVKINGIVYDAITGEPLSGSKKHKPRSFVNDVTGPANHRAHKTVIKPAHKPKAHSGRKHGHSPQAHRKVERSHTLMRPAVKKPDIQKSSSQEHAPKRLKPPVNKARLARANSITKSNKIKRFHHPAIKPMASLAVPVKVQPLPVKEPATRLQPAQAQEKNDWPVIDQFEKAMQEASSHLETFVDSTSHSGKSRKLAYALASLSIIAILGIGVFHFMPLAKIKLAGNHAGFSPGLPTYSPSGFGLAGPVQSSYGEVTLSYKSRTDDRNFKITQSPSQWNSESLVKNFLLASHPDYQTVRGGGQTIYTYGDSDATWVDGGIWYRVEGDAKLSTDQLLSIANGL